MYYGKKKTQKIFSKNKQNNEHYRKLNPKVKFDGQNKK